MTCSPFREWVLTLRLTSGCGPTGEKRNVLASSETITVIVSELAKSFRFEPAAPLPEVSLRVSTHSRNGLHVTAHSVASGADGS